MKRTVFIFDFDHTIIEGDSLFAFLIRMGGLFKFVQSFAKGTLLYFHHTMHSKENNRPRKLHHFVKDFMLGDLLGGKKLSDLEDAIASLKTWQKNKLNESVCRTILDASIAGHHIVIATGALDIYVKALLEDIPHHALLSSKMEVVDGTLTGRLELECLRERKANLVRAYLATQEPFDDSWGYGNMPDDLPMLNLVKHRIII